MQPEDVFSSNRDFQYQTQVPPQQLLKHRHQPGFQKHKQLLAPFLNNLTIPRQLIVGIILTIALVAFEIFNFDTTKYALASLLGEVTFVGVGWATILAIAFCAIDFAGLAHLFTPEKGWGEPKEIWYLTGAWFLGATMNALMTWWAVSLALLNHPLGNEILSREELLQLVPVFVAVLVWLTRILFIGALSVMGEHISQSMGKEQHMAADTPLRPHTQRPLPASPPQQQPNPVKRPLRDTHTRQRPPISGSRPHIPVGIHARNKSR